MMPLILIHLVLLSIWLVTHGVNYYLARNIRLPFYFLAIIITGIISSILTGLFFIALTYPGGI